MAAVWLAAASGLLMDLGRAIGLAGKCGYQIDRRGLDAVFDRHSLASADLTRLTIIIDVLPARHETLTPEQQVPSCRQARAAAGNFGLLIAP